MHQANAAFGHYRTGTQTKTHFQTATQSCTQTTAMIKNRPGAAFNHHPHIATRTLA
ncbi:hypothetical protein [Craterilacuibacter sinensis]|uniref:Uncharacterized protein n=1 Tax=Craterilacuibacter sinensis TaxID=2686017 RepID=A0A845BSF4_9NEIS|nr:hypothetical protein [Craterilacuibacter sinensis]MXR37126.1 hypothetical protein [Craterilacuibacter sinensis]